MHEAERHEIITEAAQRHPVVTIRHIVAMTGASEPTARRDIVKLAAAGRLRRVRGGVTALEPAASRIEGPRWDDSRAVNIAQKKAIGLAAAKLCAPGDTVIINGGTTTFQMVHGLDGRDLTVFTNSLPISDHLTRRTGASVILAGGTVYREQQIVLSAFGRDLSDQIVARRMFTGAQAIDRQGVMETDPLLIQAESRLLDRAEEIVVLADSSKFGARGSLILCPLSRVATIVTDSGISAAHRALCAEHGVELIVADAEGSS